MKPLKIILICSVVLFVTGFLIYDFWPMPYFYFIDPRFWTFEHADGRISKGRDDFWGENVKQFEASNPTGRMVYKTRKGEITGEYHLVNGKIEGREWFRDPKSGRVFHDSNYKNGKKEGIQKYWWENGQMMTFEHYKNGRPDGVMTTWFENGGIHMVRTYSNGLEVGENMDFTPSGRRIAHYWVHDNGVTILKGTTVMSQDAGQPAILGKFTNGVLIRKWQDWEKME